MSSTFKHISHDLELFEGFKSDQVSTEQKNNVMREMIGGKAWDKMTGDEKLASLLDKIQRHPLFGQSLPPFDRNFLLMMWNTTTADWDDMRNVLNDIHLYFEENAKEARRYKNFRRHFKYRVEKYVANKRYMNAKRDLKNAPPKKIQKFQSVYYCANNCKAYSKTHLCERCGDLCETTVKQIE